MNPPLTTTDSLRTAGQNPAVPFHVGLADGRKLILRQLLRVLPGKRITGIGEIDGQIVLAKLFIARHSSKRQWQREHQGINLLLDHGLPTPKLLSAGSLSTGGHYVLTEFITDAKSLSAFPGTPPLPVLAKLFKTFGLMHAQGLIHQDAHFGNFLFKSDAIFILDGDAVRSNQSPADLTMNLALLLAQLPPAMTANEQKARLAAYRSGNPGLLVDPTRLAQTVAEIQQLRLKKYLQKCLRDCSQFKVERQPGRFIAVVRSEAEALATIIADPDRWLSAGTALKKGRTATLAVVEHGCRKLVIKRYNIKGPGHALSRCWRPSRAWHSWIEGHRLEFFGIPTPRPLALIERRIGPLRREAWLITEHCAGENLAIHLAPFVNASLSGVQLEAIRDLFHQLATVRISHGDLKATNLLWNGGRLGLVDLDATHQHTSAENFRRAWRKERMRFLRNWPPTSALYATLDALLPAS